MKKDIEECRMSIILITYNHEKYIKQSLESIFSQDLDCKIELIIADDASTDKTLDIIKSFAKTDTRFTFKYLNSPINIGITKNYQRAISATSHNYVAIMEGDDYWITPYKLRTQMEFLKSHLECNMVSVNYYVYEETRGKLTPRVAIGKSSRYIKARDLIKDNLVGNFSTTMYRRSALLNLPPKIFEIKSYDWIINICISTNSLIGFIEEPMSVYRLHSAGAWTGTTHLQKLEEQLSLIPQYNELTKKYFQKEFNVLTRRLNTEIRRIKSCNSMVQTERSRIDLSIYFPEIILRAIKLIMPAFIFNFLKKYIK